MKTKYGESATIKKTEVGDIYQNEEGKFIVTDVGDSFAGGLLENKLFRAVPFDYLRENCKYLGKSVVDVSKLFTVKSFDEKQYRKDMFGEEDD